MQITIKRVALRVAYFLLLF